MALDNALINQPRQLLQNLTMRVQVNAMMRFRAEETPHERQRLGHEFRAVDACLALDD